MIFEKGYFRGNFSLKGSVIANKGPRALLFGIIRGRKLLFTPSLPSPLEGEGEGWGGLKKFLRSEAILGRRRDCLPQPFGGTIRDDLKGSFARASNFYPVNLRLSASHIFL